MDVLTRAHLFALLREPSATSYGEVLRCVVEHERFNARSNELREIQAQFAAGDFTGARDAVHTIMSLWVHSPRYHLLAHALAKHQGDEQTAEFELKFAQCCVQGMLASGDGTMDRPYQVARIDDEYALLDAMQKQWTKQTVLERDGRPVDVFECTDGAALHFQLPKIDLLTGRRSS